MPDWVLNVCGSLLTLVIAAVFRKQRVTTATLCPRCKDCREVFVVSNAFFRFIGILGALFALTSLFARFIDERIPETVAGAGFFFGLFIETSFGIRARRQRKLHECVNCNHRRPAYVESSEVRSRPSEPSTPKSRRKRR